MSDLSALLSEVKRLAAKDRSVGSAAMTRLAELAPRLADECVCLKTERNMALANLETAMVERAWLRSELAAERAAKPDLNALLRDAYIDAKLGPRDRYTCDDATFQGMVASAGAEWDGLCADERCEAMFEIGKVLNDSPASVSQVELTIEAMKADMVTLQRDLATERGKRCGSCRHWKDESCQRVKRAWAEANTQWRLVLGTAADFGCTEWEAKG